MGIENQRQTVDREGPVGGLLRIRNEHREAVILRRETTERLEFLSQGQHGLGDASSPLGVCIFFGRM
jgi:hypothetical protein